MHRNKVAPEVTMINGVPHMLAYVNRAEKDMLRRAGGTGLAGPDGIPAYGFWDNFVSNVKSAASNFVSDIAAAPGNIASDIGNMASTISSDLSNAFGGGSDNNSSSSNNSTTSSVPINNYGMDYINQQYYKTMKAAEEAAAARAANEAAAASMLDAGVSNLSGKPIPDEPANAGNPPILEYDGGSGSYSVVGALDPSSEPSIATNTDGSQYNPTNDPVNIANTSGVNNLINTGSDAGIVLPTDDGGYETIGGDKIDSVSFDPTGGGKTSAEIAAEKAAAEKAAKEAAEKAAAEAAAQAAAEEAERQRIAEEKRLAELAAALGDRDAALASQMSSLANAFGFGTDAYYGGLRDSYTADNNQAFQTAYDDAMRGIYEGFKSAGLLTQSGVDQNVSKLGSANLSETNRLGTAAEEYAKANRSFVDEGRTGIESQLQGLAVDADTADAYRAQTEAIKAFDVAGAAKPFQTPTERSVADFFSDFAKRSYDPSYNVAPTTVTTAGPSRVTQSVNQFGPNTQTSSMVGIRSPFANKQSRVVA